MPKSIIGGHLCPAMVPARGSNPQHICNHPATKGRYCGRHAGKEVDICHAQLAARPVRASAAQLSMGTMYSRQVVTETFGAKTSVTETFSSGVRMAHFSIGTFAAPTRPIFIPHRVPKRMRDECFRRYDDGEPPTKYQCA